MFSRMFSNLVVFAVIALATLVSSKPTVMSRRKHDGAFSLQSNKNGEVDNKMRTLKQFDIRRPHRRLAIGAKPRVSVQPARPGGPITVALPATFTLPVISSPISLPVNTESITVTIPIPTHLSISISTGTHSHIPVIPPPTHLTKPIDLPITIPTGTQSHIHLLPTHLPIHLSLTDTRDSLSTFIPTGTHNPISPFPTHSPLTRTISLPGGPPSLLPTNSGRIGSGLGGLPGILPLAQPAITYDFPVDFTVNVPVVTDIPVIDIPNHNYVTDSKSPTERLNNVLPSSAANTVKTPDTGLPLKGSTGYETTGHSAHFPVTETFDDPLSNENFRIDNKKREIKSD